jgi:hypothetical protein
MFVTDPEYAISSYYNYGPTFSGGYDIYLPDNSDILNGYSSIYSYQLPNFVTDKISFLAGSSSFLTDKIEVYALNGK